MLCAAVHAGQTEPVNSIQGCLEFFKSSHGGCERYLSRTHILHDPNSLYITLGFWLKTLATKASRSYISFKPFAVPVCSRAKRSQKVANRGSHQKGDSVRESAGAVKVCISPRAAHLPPTYQTGPESPAAIAGHFTQSGHQRSSVVIGQQSRSPSSSPDSQTLYGISCKGRFREISRAISHSGRLPKIYHLTGYQPYRSKEVNCCLI